MCIATEQEEIAEDEENNEVLIQNFTKKSKPSEIKSKENGQDVEINHIARIYF